MVNHFRVINFLESFVLGSAYDNSLLDDSGNATLSTTMNGTTTASNVDDNAEEDEHDRLSGFPRALRGDFEQVCEYVSLRSDEK